jgi:hypothetical protein
MSRSIHNVIKTTPERLNQYGLEEAQAPRAKSLFE